MASSDHSLLKMSEETFDFVCTSCAQSKTTVEAVKYCVECRGYCCQSCVETHQRFPALKKHNLLNVTDTNKGTNKQPILMEIPTETCSIHKGKLLDMYCEDHDVVGCYACFIKEHKHCKDSHIHSIPDMIDTIFKISDCTQTQNLLKDTISCMETLSESKDTQLAVLKTAKMEALDKVLAFQKALEATIKNIAASSMNEIEVACKELEQEILLEKHDVSSTCHELQACDKKLNLATGNRAQQFVCAKNAQGKINGAAVKRIRKDVQYKSDIHLSFAPNKSLMKLIKACQRIGQVHRYRKQEHGFYRIKGRNDVATNVSDDHVKGLLTSCCITQDGDLIVTDFKNKKLKRIDQHKMSVVDYCTLPYSLFCIDSDGDEVAVACGEEKMIQFVSIHNTMTPTRQMKLFHFCYGIAFNDNKMYVTDNGEALYVYDMDGTVLKKISHDKAGNKIFTNSGRVTFNNATNRMFVGNWDHGLVCCDGVGNYLYTINNSDVNHLCDVCVDGRGNVFVVGFKSNNVVQLSEDGIQLGVVITPNDGLGIPRAACFHQGMNLLFVTISGVLTVFELE